ncbi:protein PHLOEM PROTEIN 2-LIKE A10-like [Cucurbita maxima]|uniref:Protein PHLOEM PROTEIN 2-LIKE A10-like n=1 Tax=Cucurbita maxima TaxID=3661 RepID=A0A6J1IYZ5_CUCMA|nr:protein PHLOEM PROTEIN 2-LIKE A10-like [Cucurbita maxima]XP_022981255.1 protein PHLOEM PROTEIN 2-LIKE A10-like [Cucurbita maxima]
MDFELVRRGLGFSQRRKKWLVLLALMGVSGYGVYKVYHFPSVEWKRKRLMKLFGAMISVAEMVADSSEAIGVISKDLKEFLKSDSDRIPNSLKQISKLAKSEEFSESLEKVTEAFTVGMMRGYKSVTKNDGNLEADSVNSSSSSGVVEKLFLTAGTGFASVVVGSFAKNLVMGYYSIPGSVDDAYKSGSEFSDVPRWVTVASDEKCKNVIADCIQVFVSTAVSVYLDKTMDVNVYNDLFSGLTNPTHQDKVKDMVVSVCNGAVETLVKTSHQVLTSSRSTSNLSPVSSCNGLSKLGDDLFSEEASSKKMAAASSIESSQNGWIDTVSSTLAVPRNRKFVLDLTGRVTFETTRSVVDFLLWKLMDGLKRSFGIVHDEVVGRGLEVVSYFSAKSSVIVTICVALYLHVFYGTGLLLSA